MTDEEIAAAFRGDDEAQTRAHAWIKGGVAIALIAALGLALWVLS